MAMDNGDTGIQPESSTWNNLTGNNASNTASQRFGIVLASGSNYNNLTSNIANNNTQTGIYLGSSHNNSLSDNTAMNNGDTGIQLESSTWNNLTGNNASNTASQRFGIVLHPAATTTT